ncbi:hypothetical protein B484DRAFT_67535 [Ochromonadaceae sp. CCMP2298]|nr:hypothetical protein B484DRAFT_67535 [Ochromonadaceae sp. CCMP2298]
MGARRGMWIQVCCLIDRYALYVYNYICVCVYIVLFMCLCIYWLDAYNPPPTPPPTSSCLLFNQGGQVLAKHARSLGASLSAAEAHLKGYRDLAMGPAQAPAAQTVPVQAAAAVSGQGTLASGLGRAGPGGSVASGIGGAGMGVRPGSGSGMGAGVGLGYGPGKGKSGGTGQGHGMGQGGGGGSRAGGAPKVAAAVDGGGTSSSWNMDRELA